MSVTILDIAKETGFSKADGFPGVYQPRIAAAGDAENDSGSSRKHGVSPQRDRAGYDHQANRESGVHHLRPTGAGHHKPVLRPDSGKCCQRSARQGYSVFIVSDEEIRLPSGDLMLQKQVDGVIFASQPDLGMLKMYRHNGTRLFW
jgi:hypothetical protein